jgi:hypothetical protein
LADHPGFVNGMSQGLLAVDVLAELQGHHRDDRVEVIGRGDHHRVDVLLLFEHSAEIDVGLGAGERFEGALEVVLLDVAEGHDVFGGETADVARAHAADADAGNVELFARRGLAGAQHVTGDDGKSRCGRPGGGEALSARELALRWHLSSSVGLICTSATVRMRGR